MALEEWAEDCIWGDLLSAEVELCIMFCDAWHLTHSCSQSLDSESCIHKLLSRQNKSHFSESHKDTVITRFMGEWNAVGGFEIFYCKGRSMS